MSLRTTILKIFKSDNQPALVLRTAGALQLEVQSVGRDGATIHATTIGVDLDGSPGIYRNARLVKEADGTWHWYAVEPDQWCSSYHLDSDGRWVFKTAPPSGAAGSAIAWGGPKARFEPDGTLVCPGIIQKVGW